MSKAALSVMVVLALLVVDTEAMKKHPNHDKLVRFGNPQDYPIEYTPGIEDRSRARLKHLEGAYNLKRAAGDAAHRQLSEDEDKKCSFLSEGDMADCVPSYLPPGHDTETSWPDSMAHIRGENVQTKGVINVLIYAAAFSDTPKAEQYTDDASFPPLPYADEKADPLYMVNKYFSALSNGAVSFKSTVVRVQLTQTHPGGTDDENFDNWCTPYGSGQGYDDIANDAMNQAKQAGCEYDEHKFDMQIFLFPNVGGCFGAVADTPGTMVYMNGYPTPGSYRTMAHEIGTVHSPSFVKRSNTYIRLTCCIACCRIVMLPCCRIACVCIIHRTHPTPQATPLV
jgi:hypothetical protein